MKLYELTIAAQKLADALEETGGELTPELAAIADSIEGELPVKVASICHLITQMTAEESAIAKEHERLGKMMESRRRAASNLKTYLQRNLELQGIDKVRAGTFLVYLQNNPVAVEWKGSMDELPDSYKRTKIEVDKKAILEDLKAGVYLPSQVVVTRGRHLRIK